MMEDKQLSARLEAGSAIRTIISRPEWRVIEDMLLNEYLDALKTLIEKEDEVARAKVNAVDILYKKITNGLILADKASEYLAKKIKN